MSMLAQIIGRALLKLNQRGKFVEQNEDEIILHGNWTFEEIGARIINELADHELTISGGGGSLSEVIGKNIRKPIPSNKD